MMTSNNNGLQVLAEACTTCDESFRNQIINPKHEGNEIQSTNVHPKLYCKARRTPLDHQEERAILQFNIGEENMHGAELRCTHQVCRQNGVKFRYCAFCNKAVAKRNFRKRHAHNDCAIYNNTTISATASTASTASTATASTAVAISTNDGRSPNQGIWYLVDEVSKQAQQNQQCTGLPERQLNQRPVSFPQENDENQQPTKMQRIQRQEEIHRHPLQAINFNHNSTHGQHLNQQQPDLQHKFSVENNKCISESQSIFVQYKDTAACTSSSDKINHINCKPEPLSTKALFDSQNNLDVPSTWIELYRKRPNTDADEKQFNDWMSEVCRVAGQQFHHNKLSPAEQSIASSSKSFFEHSFNSSDFSQFEEMSSSTLNYYDKFVSEVKEEFKGMKPPRFHQPVSKDVLMTYRKHAESLSLSVNTDIESTASPSMMMLDSAGSSVISSCRHS